MKDLLQFCADVLPAVEEYRQKQVNKYYREKELEYGGEFQKLERYKNRVRIVDIFLPTIKKKIVEAGISIQMTDSQKIE